MPQFFLYLIKVNIALILCYCMYYFLLRKLTFYTLNRWFLLSSIVIASLFPLINFSLFFGKQQSNNIPSILQYAPNWENVHSVIAQSKTTLSIWGVLYFLYWLGVAFMFIYFLVQTISLLRIHLSSSKKIDTRNLRITNKNIQPFSFFKTIYLNPEKHDWQEVQTIVQHERVHTSELHTIDVIIAEINKIMYWFNPGVWLLKNAIRENLEFIADEKILAAGKNVKEYQYELLQVITGINYRSGLANQFSLFHLKNRIKMMNKNKSNKWSKAKYALLIPMLCVMAIVVAQRSKSNTPKLNTENKVYDDFERKVRETVGESAKPIWIIDGRAVIIGKGSMASFDTKEMKKDPNFKVYYDNKFYSMDEANEKFNRFKITSVGAVYKDYAKPKFGEAVNLLIINTMIDNLNPNNVNEHPNYGIPKEYINEEYQIEVKLINGVRYAIAYTKDWKEVSRIKLNSDEKDLDIWQKQYGAIPSPPPPPPPPPAPSDNPPPPPLPPPTPEKGVVKANGERVFESGTAKVEIRQVEETQNPLIEVDGEIKDKRFLDALPANNIENINVLKGNSALALYGNKGKGGVIKVTTKKNAITINSTTKKSTTITINSSTGKNDETAAKNKFSKVFIENEKNPPLIILDGKVIEKKEMDALSPTIIKTVNVLRAETAIEQFGEKGKGGVIMISTKETETKVVKKEITVL